MAVECPSVTGSNMGCEPWLTSQQETAQPSAKGSTRRGLRGRHSKETRREVQTSASTSLTMTSPHGGPGRPGMHLTSQTVGNCRMNDRLYRKAEATAGSCRPNQIRKSRQPVNQLQSTHQLDPVRLAAPGVTLLLSWRGRAVTEVTDSSLVGGHT